MADATEIVAKMSIVDGCYSVAVVQSGINESYSSQRRARTKLSITKSVTLKNITNELRFRVERFEESAGPRSYGALV